MITYCVRQKKKTECVPGSERVKIAKNGRQMLVCTCAECGATKTQFMSLSKRRKDLVSDTIKRNAEIRNIKDDIYSRSNKMTDFEKEEIRDRLRKLADIKRSNSAAFQEIDRILTGKLQMPDLSEFKQRPDLDQKIQSLISKMPKKQAKRLTAGIDPELDWKYQEVVNKMLQSKYNKLLKNQGN